MTTVTKSLLWSCMGVLMVAQAYALEPITTESRGLGGTVMLSEPSASTLARVPAGSMPSKQWVFDASFDRRFELKDLDQLGLNAAYQLRPVILSLGLSQFGEAELYSEWASRLGASVRIDSLSIGVFMTNMVIGIGDYRNKMRYTTVGAGLSYRTNYVLAAITGDNLTSPEPHDGAVSIEPIYSVYLEARRGPLSSYSLTGRVTMEDGQKPQYGLGQKVRVSSLGSLLMGVSTEPFEFGGGIELRFSGFSLNWVATNHPDLGLSYTVGFGYGG